MPKNALHVKRMILRHAPAAAIILGSMLGIYHTLDLVNCVDFSPLVLWYLLNLAFVLWRRHVMNDQFLLVNKKHGYSSSFE